MIIKNSTLCLFADQHLLVYHSPNLVSYIAHFQQLMLCNTCTSCWWLAFLVINNFAIWDMNFWVSTGLAIFSCMPTTLSSGVALTQVSYSVSFLVFLLDVFYNKFYISTAVNKLNFAWVFSFCFCSLLGEILHLLLQWL